MRAVQLVLASLGLLPGILAAQQLPGPIVPSLRHRVTLSCLADSPRVRCPTATGRLVRLGIDSLAIADDTRVIGSWRKAEITALEIRTVRPWNMRRGLIYGGIAAASGAAIGFAAGHGTPDRTTYTLAGVAGGGLVGFLVASRPNALKGFLLGTAASAAIGLAASSGCSECRWPVLLPIGAVAGSIVGSLFPSSGWTSVPIR